MQIAYHVMSSPVGLLFLARTERGLRYLGFMERKSLKRMIARHADENPGALWRPSLLELKPVVDQLEAYFHGSRTDFTVPLDPVGSEFQLRVWRELCRIPYGRTRTYGEIASLIGQPRGARAVGLANNQNPIAIVVPCHRVIGADGGLVGYGGGMARKKWLLDNEARFAQPVGRTGDLFGTVAAPSPARAVTAAHAATHAAPVTKPTVKDAAHVQPAAKLSTVKATTRPQPAAKLSTVKPAARPQPAAKAPAGKSAVRPARATAARTGSRTTTASRLSLASRSSRTSAARPAGRSTSAARKPAARSAGRRASR